MKRTNEPELNNTTQTAPVSSETKSNEPPITKTLFDLDSFEEVTLVKPAPFTPVTSMSEGLARINNDASKALDIFNKGLRLLERERIASDSEIPWMLEDEEGNLSEFSGTPADNGVVNALRLNLAKSIFGYNNAKTPEERKAAKQKALDFIKSNEQIKSGLKENASQSATAAV